MLASIVHLLLASMAEGFPSSTKRQESFSWIVKQGGSWQGHFTMSQSHGTISQSCLFQLLLPDIRSPEDGLTQDEQNPYVAYAASYWPLHFTSQEAASADKFRTQARILCDASGHQANVWAPIYFKQQLDESWGVWLDLPVASYLGLREVVHDILLEEKLPVDVEERGHSCGRTALLWAAKQGYEAIVELLLEKGADIQAKDNVSRTPLQWAARGGHEAVVELLLEKGADIEATDCDSYNPLFLAAKFGQVATVELLLYKEADTETLIYNNRLDAEKGFEAMVKSLQKGAKTRRLLR